MINSASEQESLSSISSAADKIPPFWVQDPELWFYHIETVFKGDKIINSKTKFQILISKIQIDVLVPVRDVIKCPGDKPYEKIKSRLISTYLESETRRIQQLLEGKNLGNRKPSQLLKLIIKLAGYGTATGVVKTLWMKYLPQNIHSILISTGLEDINKLAEFADKLQEALAPEMDSVVNQGCSFYYPQDEEYLIEEEAVLEAKIIDLSRQIALMSSVIKLNQSRTYNNGSGRDLQINNDYSNCMCYYHFKFGDKARKCSTPCSWVRTNHTSYNELQEPLW